MKALYEKLAKIQGLKCSKDAINPFYESKYMTLDGIVKTLEPILEEHKLLIYHASKDGCMETHLIDLEGEGEITSSFRLPDLLDIQKLGAGVTYAKRYNLGQIFNIITEGDDDGNKTVKATKPVLTMKDIEDAVIPKIEKERSEGIDHDAKEVIKKMKAAYDIKSKEEETIIQFINKK